MKKIKVLSLMTDEKISKRIVWEELKKEFPTMSHRIKIIRALVKASSREKEKKNV